MMGARTKGGAAAIFTTKGVEERSFGDTVTGTSTEYPSAPIRTVAQASRSPDASG